MWHDKQGLNLCAVVVEKPQTYGDVRQKCLWIGATRFRCGNCKKGYFDVRSEYDHDLNCPECRWHVRVQCED